MTPRFRLHLRALAIPLSLVTLAIAASEVRADEWGPYREDSVIEIITVDPDGERRETKVWVVVLDGSIFVRTNDSRWLANIERDPAIVLRARGEEQPYVAQVDDDSGVYDRVEEAFVEKYGLMQKVMSAMRVGQPTVLRISEGPGA